MRAPMARRLRLALLLIVLAAILIGALIGERGCAVPAVFVALFVFVEAVERGYVGAAGASAPEPDRARRERPDARGTQ